MPVSSQINPPTSDPWVGCFDRSCVSHLPENEARNVLGEHVFQRVQPLRAGRGDAAQITGLILGLSVAEIVHTLETPGKLEQDVMQAVAVLGSADASEAMSRPVHQPQYNHAPVNKGGPAREKKKPPTPGEAPGLTFTEGQIGHLVHDYVKPASNPVGAPTPGYVAPVCDFHKLPGDEGAAGEAAVQAAADAGLTKPGGGSGMTVMPILPAHAVSVPPAAPEERRVDVSDSNPYSFTQFIDCYGPEAGPNHWADAPPEKRRDPSDEKLYTFTEFVQCYGFFDGERRWSVAGGAPAPIKDAPRPTLMSPRGPSVPRAPIAQGHGGPSLATPAAAAAAAGNEDVPDITGLDKEAAQNVLGSVIFTRLAATRDRSRGVYGGPMGDAATITALLLQHDNELLIGLLKQPGALEREAERAAAAIEASMPPKGPFEGAADAAGAPRDLLEGPPGHQPATGFQMSSDHPASPERRIDVADGKPYTFAEFVACYGPSDGAMKWGEAPLIARRGRTTRNR